MGFAMSRGDTVSFVATLPLIQSAIKVSGDGGMRVQLEIADDQMDKAIGILSMRGEVLHVTIRVVKEGIDG